MESSSSNPYPCQETADGKGYEFFPKGGGRCIIVTTSAAADFAGTSFAHHALVLSIRSEASGAKRIRDQRITDTILWFLEMLFDYDRDALVVWGCSALNDEELLRHRMFAAWYSQRKAVAGSASALLVKKDFHPAPKEYISFLYRADNRARAEIERISVSPLSDK